MTAPMELVKEGEVVATVESTALVVWIDETGHERFADPEDPVFGLGGCAAFAGDYQRLIHNPWMEMKRTAFGAEEQPLHAAEMHNVSPDQLDAIGNVFRTRPFFRVAVTLTDAVDLPKEVDAYHIVARALYNRIIDVAEPVRVPSRVVMILEEADRLRGLATRCFSGYEVVADSGGERRQLPMRHYFMPKSPHEAGLEVADFVMHAIGGKRRTRYEGDERKRRDYQSVVEEVDADLVSVFNISGASLNGD